MVGKCRRHASFWIYGRPPVTLQGDGLWGLLVGRVWLVAKLLLALWASGAGFSVFSSQADWFDISLAGPPTLSGAVGNFFVIPSSATTMTNLVVNADLGELGPANPNSFVVLTIPVAIRSSRAYQVDAFISGATFGADPDSIQANDFSVSVQNVAPLDPLGLFSNLCNNHTVMPPYNNSGLPSSYTPRAVYPATIANFMTQPTLIYGPRLSNFPGVRLAQNGYRFDFVIRIAPQYYANGNVSFTLNLSISGYPTNLPCL